MANGFYKVVLEWHDRPDRDQEWYERERATNPEFAREQELVWGAASGTPVFSPLYKRVLHEVSMGYLRGQTVFRGWDFGFVHPACVWAQFDGSGQLGIRRELLGEDETIDKFGARVVEISGADFPGATFRDYGDPAGAQRNDRSERTSIQILKDLFGIKVKTRPSEIKQGIDLIRVHLLARSDGRPGIVVDPGACPLLSYGFARAYIRDEKDPEKPFKDGYYDHLFDALRYMGIHVLKTPKRTRQAQRPDTPQEAERAAIWKGLRQAGKRSSDNPVTGDW